LGAFREEKRRSCHKNKRGLSQLEGKKQEKEKEEEMIGEIS
jgi:hypothetical protein